MSKAQYRLPLWALKVATRLSGRDTGVSDELKHAGIRSGVYFYPHSQMCGECGAEKFVWRGCFWASDHPAVSSCLPKRLYDKAWKFTVTRDPWERIVSAWRFLKAGGLHKHDADYFAENLSRYASFDHFVNDWLVYQDLDQCGCVHFKTQLHYLRNLRGEVAMDSIIKLSDLADEYPELRNRLGGDELMVDNQTKGEDVDWRQYYASEETLENVSRVYAEDIQVLGYSPE